MDGAVLPEPHGHEPRHLHPGLQTRLPVGHRTPLPTALGLGATTSAPRSYNVLSDPSEYQDVADLYPEVVGNLTARLVEVQAGVFSPNRGVSDFKRGESGGMCLSSRQPPICTPRATGCAGALSYGGFFGPFLP